MWVITYRGKPATLEKIYEVEHGGVPIHIDSSERPMMIAAAHRKEAIEGYLSHIGFTWEERKEGIDVKRFTRTSNIKN